MLIVRKQKSIQKVYYVQYTIYIIHTHKYTTIGCNCNDHNDNFAQDRIQVRTRKRESEVNVVSQQSTSSQVSFNLYGLSCHMQ